MVVPRTKDAPAQTEPFCATSIVFARLLDYSLLFYEAQRSGKLPSDQRVKWRKDSVLDDGKDAGVDLSGGYFDAGDYIKFIFPLTFTMTETCWGALEFWEGYRLANQTQYLNQMVRWGMDWLIKAHPNNNTLYVQVGSSDIDNDYWGPDTNIPKPRPSYFVSNTRPGTDAVADAAAAFAACGMLYRDKLNDTTYSNTLQTHADSLYRLAESATPQQVYQKAVPAASCCYPSSGFMDDLLWSSAWMYKLTKSSVYAQKASRYVDQLNAEYVQKSPVTWDNKMGLSYILMAGATIGTSDNQKWWTFAEKFGDFTVNAPKPCTFTKAGLYYCNGNSGDDSAVVAANAAFAMHLWANQIVAKGNIDSATQEKIDTYRSFALGQINYLLGDNPEKTPYIVGVHPNSPINPHSAPASGGNDPGTIDSYPEKERYTLYGALVGGPDKNDRFDDRRSNWRQNEVALDYNAPFNGLMAYQVMTSKESPPYVVIPAGRPDLPPILNGMEVWQIILIIVGSAFVAIGIGAIVCYRKRDQIRAWAAAKKQKRTVNSAPIRTAKPSSAPKRTGQQQQAAAALATPPPPPPPPPPPAQTPRPVPPPPLPPREEEPILLEDARPSS
ncbi:hypothetical protein BGX34_005442 [Mortierella sp. NVP85]|nr:hypothetical protein BGX34_005442 [Mortierella sp. NVP85]